MKKLLVPIIASFASAAVVLPGTSFAAPKLEVDSITSQCVNGATTITVTLNALSFSSFNGQMQFAAPFALAGTAWPLGANPATFNVPAGPGSLQVTAPISTAPPSVASPLYTYLGATCGNAQTKGMTWRLTVPTNATTGTIDVGCGYNECNPYTGDTACSVALPVLCYDPAALPLPANGIVNNADPYHRWSGGIVATTPPVAGNSFGTIAAANGYCKQVFGNNWRVAEFHDGWGWYFQAYGGVGQPAQRFWVDINDQRSTQQAAKATCWTN